MVKVVIECQFCGIGKETGEIAVIDREGEEICIQSKDGGFVCKGCWEKFMSFLHDDSKIILCGANECEPSEEEPKKSWPPRDADGLTDQQKYPVIEDEPPPEEPDKNG